MIRLVMIPYKVYKDKNCEKLVASIKFSQKKFRNEKRMMNYLEKNSIYYHETGLLEPRWSKDRKTYYIMQEFNGRGEFHIEITIGYTDIFGYKYRIFTLGITPKNKNLANAG